MAPTNSLDEVVLNLIANLLHDVSTTLGGVISNHDLDLTINKVRDRVELEGISFITKTLPTLGKAFDRALSSDDAFDCQSVRLEPSLPDGKLPKLFGELFSRVFDNEGKLLPSPCVPTIGSIRQILYSFYKYELPYTASQEREVIEQFVRTEDDLSITDAHLREIEDELSQLPTSANPRERSCMMTIARGARHLLAKVFERFDPTNILPCHGPGAVATKQRLWEKYEFSNIARSIAEQYPIDAYFCASTGHVCDSWDVFSDITDESLPARVILVPKDSRGPRLISCEPVDFQWVQGGLRRAMVDHVEKHYLTRGRVNFTRQEPNQQRALKGSIDGSYATLDLKEASDRVSHQLVHLLWPEHLQRYLDCCRSLATQLPDGTIMPLRKFAPMGSSLCFPVMALTIWALVTSASTDKNVRKDILVYGDDVIVPGHFARDAIEVLEAFGLQTNPLKCCYKGLFRESCGVDAYAGVNVTPVRFRTVWSSSQSPNVYLSWIAKANQLWDKRYYRTYEYIVELLTKVYGEIPEDAMRVQAPSLRSVSQQWLPKRSKVSKRYQKLRWLVWDVVTPVLQHESQGWIMLLRYFAEAGDPQVTPWDDSDDYSGSRGAWAAMPRRPFRVRSYTRRGTSKLVRRWR